MAQYPSGDRRKEIIQGIRGIQPVAGKNLRDVEVPQRLYELAKEVAEKQPFHIRFKVVPVYRLLLDHISVKGEQGSVVPEATLAGWQQASKALFRYALNLVLAPKRPEFKKMKLSSSYYVYNISRNLHGAEQVFIAMGYRGQVVGQQGKGGQDLVYEGDVKQEVVLETATDLLVMHEEVGLIRELMARGTGRMTLEQAIMQQYQMNTPQNTRSAGVNRHQPPPQPPPRYSGYPLNPQEGGKGSYNFRNERGTSGDVPSQPPHQMMHGQPPQHVGQSQPPTAQGHPGMGVYERGVFAPLPLEAGMEQQQSVGPDQAHEELHQKARPGAMLAARGGAEQQCVAGHGGYSTGGGTRPLNLPQTHTQVDPNVQRARWVDHTSGQVPPAPASGPVHAPALEPPADATLYQNVPYQNNGSEAAIYQNAKDLRQPETNSEGDLEHTTVTQEMWKLFQQYPDLAGLPPQQKDTKQPALDDDADLYGDDSNPVPVDTQPGPPTEAELSGFDPNNLPGPMFHFSSTPVSTPASEFYSGITSSLVYSRSGGEGGRLSPVEEQPQGLGDRVNDPEYQQRLQRQLDNPAYQQQRDNSQGRSPSTDSNMSIDLYGSGQSQQLEKLRRAYSRGQSTSTDSKESSIDLYTSGSGDKFGKYALCTVREEPTNPPSDLAPPHPSPSPLSHGTAHPPETNTQHPAGRPALQVQGSQDDTARPIEPEREVVKRLERDMGKRPIPAPRTTLNKQVKSHSVDEVEQDGEGGGRKHHVMRTSASGSDLLQYERHSQSSEPSSPGRLDKPIPSPRRSRSSSPLSSKENSPSNSPTPARRKISPVPEHSSQPPGPQLGVSMPPKAQSVDTETQRRKEIRRQNPVDRYSSGGLEAATAALAHTSQASPSPAYVPEPPPTQKSSCDLPPNAPVMGISPLAATAAKRKQGDGLSSNPPEQPPPGQPPSSQPLSGHPPTGRPQPPYGQPSYGQPPSSPCQPSSHQPIQSQAPDQLLPSHSSQIQSNQQPSSQPSSHQPDWLLRQPRQPPSELPTTHPPSDQKILSPPGPLPPKSAPSVSANTAAAETIDTSESDQSDLDQRRFNKLSVESLEKNLGQDNSKLRRQEHGKEPVARKRSNAVSEPSKPRRKSAELNSSAEDEGGSTEAITAAELEEQYKFSLGETWVCSYCTNLVNAARRKCDVCGRDKLETVV